MLRSSGPHRACGLGLFSVSMNALRILIPKSRFISFREQRMLASIQNRQC